ncbi:hypothetical protein VTK26DRAFT_4138 [Humicola hyalothermophila]
MMAGMTAPRGSKFADLPASSILLQRVRIRTHPGMERVWLLMEGRSHCPGLGIWDPWRFWVLGISFVARNVGEWGKAIIEFSTVFLGSIAFANRFPCVNWGLCFKPVELICAAYQLGSQNYSGWLFGFRNQRVRFSCSGPASAGKSLRGSPPPHPIPGINAKIAKMRRQPGGRKAEAHPRAHMAKAAWKEP